MIITKILFSLIIIICIFFYILYVWNFSLVLLAVFIALPIIMFISGIIAKRGIEAEFAVQDNSVPKNQSFPVQLCITNNSIVPIGKAEARIEYYNIFNNKIHQFEIFFPIQAKNSQRITFQVSSKYCGIVKIKADSVRIFDPLRIFKFKAVKNIITEVAVLPEGHEISGTVNYTDRSNEESSVFSETKAGDDPSEVFDLRGYIPGDKLNRIHWKLSSKKDEFIVKEYSMPVDVPSILFVNLLCYEDSDYRMAIFDTLIESLVSASQFLLENERLHSIVFYNETTKEFEENTVSGMESLSAVIRKLIVSVNDNLACEPPETYFQLHPELSLASFTFITSSADSPSLTYIDEDMDADIKNAVVVVKSPEAFGEIPTGYSNLNVIPVVIGRISASIKDIEF